MENLKKQIKKICNNEKFINEVEQILRNRSQRTSIHINIYISGKITGLLEKEYAKNFQKAENWCKFKNFSFVNPLKLAHTHDGSWSSYMLEDIKAMTDCTCIYLIQNWKDSPGARIEKLIADYLGFATIHENPLAKGGFRDGSGAKPGKYTQGYASDDNLNIRINRRIKDLSKKNYKNLGRKINNFLIDELRKDGKIN